MTNPSAGSPGPRNGSSETELSPRLPAFLKSPAVKCVLIGLLTIVLLLPSTLVWILVEERADRARDVATDIARSWGGTQTVNGPYLVIPFTETVPVGEGEKHKQEVRHRTAVLFPERLEITGEIDVEERRKSIYKLPVYQGKFALTGRFSAPPPGMFEPVHGGTIAIAAGKAAVVLGISDVRALRSEVALNVRKSAAVQFEPGLGPFAKHGGSGINAAILPAVWQKGFSFEMALQLNGSRSIYVAPAGQTTAVKLQSDWPHPGFTGAFLPENREITETGFEAAWTIPYLARGIPKMLETSTLPLSDKVMGVKFVEPVNFYQTISRSLKYAIGFISLTFLAVFVLEIRSAWQFHWIQYGLVGIALIIFYLMLLALSEHIGYGPAYLIAASAATVLNTVYVGTSLKSRGAGVIMALVLGGVFGALYALMREQDYALLIGAMIAFAALAVTMFATQKIDWTGARPLQPSTSS
ncbi:cell envelope integrity protein CreD [Labrenzia sp. PHM005]|uniref:cell envelope integrity protein CreD n=1 Tax=Labrenzia sp. PHM005 TaxID=2590016 RepID=UPI00114000E5|nr:cell envelope integrity protein CreD [Labrenzia sp. PHM005]QDG74702.1 cell envelope integrity protein CreD [Labrenzia sp. PHM005]